MKNKIKKITTILIATVFIFAMSACKEKKSKNLIISEQEDKKIVNLFGPMEKTNPEFDNVARNAFDTTIAIAEKKINLLVEYKKYTA